MSVPGSDFNWSTSPYGYIFMGLQPATDKDFEQIGGVENADPFSIVGRYNKWWTAKIWLANETTSEKPGGLGSEAYETQFLGEGVMFRAEDAGACFHVNPQGEYVNGVISYKDTGRSYHKDAETGGTLVAGPAPGSEAETLLGKGSYIWDNFDRLWIIG